VTVGALAVTADITAVPRTDRAELAVYRTQLR